MGLFRLSHVRTLDSNPRPSPLQGGLRYRENYPELFGALSIRAHALVLVPSEKDLHQGVYKVIQNQQNAPTSVFLNDKLKFLF